MVAGDAVNTAARLQSVAPVGAVLVGEEAYASTRGAIEYERASPIAAKGKRRPFERGLRSVPRRARRANPRHTDIERKVAVTLMAAYPVADAERLRPP